MSAPYVYPNPHDRCLTRDNIHLVLAELKKALVFDSPLVCDLSASGLTLDCVAVLPAELKALKHVHALDLSLNGIRATWQELTPIVKSFLDDKAVKSLDLSMNHLPALQSLEKDADLSQTYTGFGEKLSLGLDGNPLTGNKNADHWIIAGRRFKREAYGYEYDVYSQQG